MRGVKTRYVLVRSRRRTLGIYVGADGKVTVRAPLRLPVAAIDAMVAAKEEWIQKKQALCREAEKAVLPIELREGALIPYLGENYALSFRDVPAPRLEGGAVLLPVGADEDSLRRWLRAEALAVVTHRAELYARLMGVEYTAVKISNARGRWGSCSGKNSLNFAWRLVFCPLTAIDYVVVHELSHIRHKDHGRDFWAQVAAVLADHKRRRDWLKQNRRVMELL